MSVSVFFKSILSCCIIFFTFQNAYSVNIFSWWDYIDKNTLEKVQKDCNTTVTLDEYYSTDEFLRRYNENNHSVIIFSGEAYHLVADKIKKTNINFSDVTKNYHPNILSSFKKQPFYNHVFLFGLGTSGFLYNKELLTITNNESINSIFEKANNKKVILLDDFVESLKLVSYQKYGIYSGNIIKKFEKLLENKSTIITNDFPKIIEDDDFALGYFWIGLAYDQILQNKKLKFMHHSELSYVNSDLLTVTNNDSDSICVAKALAKKEVLDPILLKGNYFSPYGAQNGFVNPDLVLENKKFVENIKSMQWIENPSIDDFQKMSNIWQRIKIAIKK